MLDFEPRSMGYVWEWFMFSNFTTYLEVALSPLCSNNAYYLYGACTGVDNSLIWAPGISFPVDRLACKGGMNPENLER